MIPQAITDIAEEYADNLDGFIGVPRYTIEQLNDLKGKEVYVIRCNILPEHRGLCIGNAPILVGKGSHFRRPTKKEEAAIYRDICRRDPVYDEED